LIFFNLDDLEILPQVDADFTEGGGGEGGVGDPPPTEHLSEKEKGGYEEK